MSTITINITISKSTTLKEGIQAVFMKKRLWPLERLKLVCDALKCTTPHAISTFGICVCDRKCNSCKEAKDYSRK